jgi:hypothetical protein
LIIERNALVRELDLLNEKIEREPNHSFLNTLKLQRAEIKGTIFKVEKEIERNQMRLKNKIY